MSRCLHTPRSSYVWKGRIRCAVCDEDLGAYVPPKEAK